MTKKLEIDAKSARFVGSLAVEVVAARGLAEAYNLAELYNTDELRLLYKGAHTYAVELAGKFPQGGEVLLGALMGELNVQASSEQGDKAQAATAAILVAGAVLSNTARGLGIDHA
jgi:hypothetical protein